MLNVSCNGPIHVTKICMLKFNSTDFLSSMFVVMKWVNVGYEYYTVTKHIK